MTLELIKGQKCSLTKDNPLLGRIIVGMGWNEARAGVEIDFSVFYLPRRRRLQQRRILFSMAILRLRTSL